MALNDKDALQLFNASGGYPYALQIVADNPNSVGTLDFYRQFYDRLTQLPRMSRNSCVS